MPFLAKLSQFKEKIKTSHDEDRLKEFMTTKQFLRRHLKEFFGLRKKTNPLTKATEKNKPH